MRTALLALALLAGAPALAQHHGQPGAGHAPAGYAPLQQRAIKALSDEQIADLRAGRGMGLALPAELNGYPGPSHTLEHADALGLSPEQRARTHALFEAMRAEAIPLGEDVIRGEATLEELFAGARVTPERLTHATSEIGARQARLRAAHLRYHLAMMDVLSPAQVERYRELRGYASAGRR
jgi:Spy/CpxP family protein refolding chaperone